MDSPTGVHYNVKQAEMPVLAMSGAIGAPVSQGAHRKEARGLRRRAPPPYMVAGSTDTNSPLVPRRLRPDPDRFRQHNLPHGPGHH